MNTINAGEIAPLFGTSLSAAKSEADQAAGPPTGDECGNGGQDKAEVRRLEIIELAQAQHQEEGVIEIDDDALLSEGADNGCYVAAWVWVEFADTAFDKEKQGDPGKK